MEVFPDFSVLLQAARMLEENKPPVYPNYRSFEPTRTRGDYDGETDDEGPTVPNRGNRYEPYKRPVDAHNEIEKKRRAYLTECYGQLRDTLPGIAGTKASNVTVLRTAAAQIAALQEEERALLHAHAEQLRLRAVLTGMGAAQRSETIIQKTAAPKAFEDRLPPRAHELQYIDSGFENRPTTTVNRALDSDGDDFEVPDTLSRRATPEPEKEALSFSATELAPELAIKHHAVHSLSPSRPSSKLMMLAGAINEPTAQTKSGRRVRLSAKALATL